MKFFLKSFGVFSCAAMLSLVACNSNTDTAGTGTTDSTGGNTSNMSSGNGSGNTGTTGAPDNAGTNETGDSLKKGSGNNIAITNANPEQATIDYMVTDNTKEMAWLMAGEKNGTDKEIKAHAKMMLADHKKLGDKVTSFISKKNLTTPTVDTMGVVNLTEAKGKEWDKAWVNKMAEEHQGLLDKLKQSETQVRDTTLKNLIVATQPVVKSHLDMVKRFRAK